MSNLEEFRKETRSWLEENCPRSMRTPTPEEEVIWGGRKQEWINPDSKIWMERMAERGWTGSEVATRVRRRRPFSRRGQGAYARDESH